MSKTKLEKVLEHLLNNEEGQAKALLHQIFIEKARAIHEELMTHEEDDMMEVGGSGDQGEDFMHDVEEMSDDISDDDAEIEFEEVMSEEDEDMMDMETEVSDETEDDMEDMTDMGDMEGAADHGGELSGMEKGIDALTKALEELEAEFERIKDQGGEQDHEGDEDLEADETEVDVMDQPEGEEEGEEEEVEEVEEDWDALSEAVSLDVVDQNPMQSQKTPGEVGSGKFASDVGARAKSPVPASQKERMGAKPVDPTKGGHHSGYNRESAPSSATLKHTQGDNRRKKATDHMGHVSKEGASGAILNKSTEGNKKSPLTRAPAK